MIDVGVPFVWCITLVIVFWMIWYADVLSMGVSVRGVFLMVNVIGMFVVCVLLIMLLSEESFGVGVSDGFLCSVCSV